MAYVTNGEFRQTILTVTTSLNGVDQPARQHSILNGFTAPSGTQYQAITATAFAQLSNTAYQARLADFLRWVDTQEHVDFDPSLHISNKAFGKAGEPGGPSITCANNT